MDIRDRPVVPERVVSSSNVQTSYIVTNPKICFGKPRIAGTRMAVKFIVCEYTHWGLTPEEICVSHPGITLAQVHAALSYYHDHKEEMDREAREEIEWAGRMEREQAIRGQKLWDSAARRGQEG